MPPPDLDHLQALADAATPGPWSVIPDPGSRCVECDVFLDGDTPMVAHKGTVGLFVAVPDEREEDNAAFIAAARAAVPALIAMVRQLQQIAKVERGTGDAGRQLRDDPCEASAAGRSEGTASTSLATPPIAESEAHLDVLLDLELRAVQRGREEERRAIVMFFAEGFCTRHGLPITAESLNAALRAISDGAHINTTATPAAT